MTSRRGDELVGVYMGRLGAGLVGVPAERRDEIVGEIAGHIAEQRAALEHETDDDVRQLLARVGEPEELAAAATAEGSVQRPPRRIGAVEVLALVLLPIVWPIGVILLWLSPAWSNRDRLIGTVLSLGGYPAILTVGPALLLLGPVSTCTDVGDGQTMHETCTGMLALPDWAQFIVGAGMVVLGVLVLAMPILVAIYLAVRLRRSTSGPVLAAA